MARRVWGAGVGILNGLLARGAIDGGGARGVRKNPRLRPHSEINADTFMDSHVSRNARRVRSRARLGRSADVGGSDQEAACSIIF